MKDIWIYDILWRPPTVVEIDAEFIGWVYAQYAERINEVNEHRRKRLLADKAEKIENKQVSVWKKIAGVF